MSDCAMRGFNPGREPLPIRREIDGAVAEAYGIAASVLADWRERLAKV